MKNRLVVNLSAQQSLKRKESHDTVASIKKDTSPDGRVLMTAEANSPNSLLTRITRQLLMSNITIEAIDSINHRLSFVSREHLYTQG